MNQPHCFNTEISNSRAMTFLMCIIKHS